MSICFILICLLYQRQDLAQESKRFSRIDKGWTKTMKRAYDTRNVLQCCYGEDIPKAVVLRHIADELESCFKVYIAIYFISSNICMYC